MVAFRLLPITGLSTFSSPSHKHQLLLGISSNISPPNHQRAILESQLISVLQSSTSLAHLKHVHAHLLRTGLDQSSFVLSKLLRTLTNLNLPVNSYARHLFDHVHYPNPFLYTALIRAYALRGPFSQSLLLYSRMRRVGTRPLSFTFSALFKACAALPDVDAGRQVHAQTISIGGFDSDLYVNNTLIDFYVRCGCLEDARRVFDEMPERDVISWTTLIVAYAKRGDMDAAEELFSRLPEKDMVAWTAMVAGFAQNARPRDALRLFERMQVAKVETDEVTLVGVISACAQLGAANYARWIRDVAERAGFGPETNVVVGSALIDMYAKCGSVEEAYRVFEGMTEHNVFSYSAMIVGFAMHGQADAAMRLFKTMVSKTEVKPNGVTFIGMLTACSHAGMVEQGRQYFESMLNDYRIVPSADHYACMVDLLGRAGHVEEAHNLINTMPFEPHGGVWGALLGACRIHGKPHIAEIAANHLFELEPNGIGNYILLSNIYASAGMWDDVSRVRKLMREKGLKKNPGCSWVESKDGVVHEFFAGDSSHPKVNDIKVVLEELLERLKQAGYTPKLRSVVYDVSNEEKERLLKNHSEKLALAFGLLTTSPGSVVRIVKNLRMCEDCHSVMRSASLVEKREIVVRDNMRFHHFREGVCSCGDFW
ncbi:pentatricopeptide repeat-containing protein At5g44230 [Magnolia sinica]|uniref:pentatricopeptide repeat-containing protein At5g44230 n=1 Tax=Magnolia sinica TaxID=86752 RepID=UPI00265B4355|nr:pentatricopeptide repeat-containing protein At5g44230 [Magnolia sinica]